METQARVMATLNKVKEARAKKQEQLGAIEDAVNEVKAKAEKIEQELSEINASFGQEVVDAINVIVNEADYMISVTGANESQFEEKIAEFNQIVSELYQVGIEYDQSVVGKIEQEFKDTGKAARIITELDTQTFYR